MRGGLSGGGWGLSFPGWLSNYSKKKRSEQLLLDLHRHLGVHCMVGKTQLNQNYLPLLKIRITHSLIINKVDGITGTIQFMDRYTLTRDDWDSIIELAEYKGQPTVLSQIDTRTKSTFTRLYNKSQHVLPFSLKAKPSRQRSGSPPSVFKDYENERFSEPEVSETSGEEEFLKDRNIKAKSSSKKTNKRKTACTDVKKDLDVEQSTKKSKSKRARTH
ncbi:replication factor C subunit 1-like [Zophobas morio]|uniref:replication factor C subunit 1-like n=1 Tax=Zophobas morio TaxID=2755281 RepID=UPI003083D292